MNIGEAAQASGISAKMVRYYEAIGLIQPPKRRPSGYRQYDLPCLHRLRLIRIARDSGFSLVDIRDILALWDDRKRGDAETKKLALAKVGELKQRVEQIEEMIDTFRQLIVQCVRPPRRELATQAPPIQISIAAQTTARGVGSSNVAASIAAVGNPR